jgi:hypothetical protein
LRDLVAAGPFSRAATDAEQLLMRGTDQMLAKRHALGKRLLRTP